MVKKKESIMLLLKCALHDSKNSKFLKAQESSTRSDRNKSNDSKWFIHNKYFILKI